MPTGPAGAAQEVTPEVPVATGGGAPGDLVLEVEAAREEETGGVDPALLAPAIADLPQLEGLALRQVSSAVSGEPDPSVERLEPLATFEGLEVEFYEERHPDGSLRLQGHRTTLDDGSTRLHGPEWRWFANGQLHLRRQLRLGRIDGPFEEWHEGGLKKAEGGYVEDFANGTWVRWVSVGALWKVSPLVRGKAEGVELVLFDSGTVNQRIEWRDGQKHGIERVWSRRGLPLEVSGWKEGRRHGTRRQWHGRGIISLEAEFVDGKRQGPYRQNWKNGAPHLVGRYEAGQRVGEWRQTAEDGTLLAIEGYAAGQLDGEVRRWNAEGILVFEGQYAAGTPVGVQRRFFDGGGPEAEETYVDGVLEGPLTTWHPTGGKASEGEMVAGKREGMWTQWDRSGEVLEAWSGLYRDGQRVRD